MSEGAEEEEESYDVSSRCTETHDFRSGIDESDRRFYEEGDDNTKNFRRD
jgi:hypothetical protein